MWPTPDHPELPDLDEGEVACIRLALAANVPALLLMDERTGRAVAQECGLQVAGRRSFESRVQSLVPGVNATDARRWTST